MQCFLSFLLSTAGGILQMQECSSSVESGDGRSVFATTPTGQIKMPRLGNYCLTMSGDGAAKLDIGAGADVSATSSSAQHMASSIVDGSSESHWASGFDPTSTVDVVLDFGAAKLIETVSIEWEHPPLVSEVCIPVESAFVLFHLWACSTCPMSCERHSNCRLLVAEYGIAFLQQQVTTSTLRSI